MGVTRHHNAPLVWFRAEDSCIRNDEGRIMASLFASKRLSKELNKVRSTEALCASQIVLRVCVTPGDCLHGTASVPLLAKSKQICITTSSAGSLAECTTNRDTVLYLVLIFCLRYTAPYLLESPLFLQKASKNGSLTSRSSTQTHYTWIKPSA